MGGPDKKKLYPNENIKSVCYISNLPKRPNVEIGEYTYYSDNKNSPEKFYDNIEHHYEFLGDKLIIGKFCAIAEGVRFIIKWQKKPYKIVTKSSNLVWLFTLRKVMLDASTM